jgi:nicotinate-nucleotide adenylyltransferase
MSAENLQPISKRRVALFGGAFDPFHRGHSAAIQHLLEKDSVDRVVVIPSGDRPDKPGVLPAAERLAMTRIGVAASFANDTRIEVSDLQVTGKIGYATIDLVTHYAQDPSIEPLVVIGQELLPDLPGWVRSEQLRERATFLVLQRPGTKAACPLPGWHCVISQPFDGSGVFISSTELRERLSRGERCEEVLSQEVYEYCRTRQLYGVIKNR